jgi:hypothetical protein
MISRSQRGIATGILPVNSTQKDLHDCWHKEGLCHLQAVGLALEATDGCCFQLLTAA